MNARRAKTGQQQKRFFFLLIRHILNKITIHVVVMQKKMTVIDNVPSPGLDIGADGLRYAVGYIPRALSKKPGSLVLKYRMQ